MLALIASLMMAAMPAPAAAPAPAPQQDWTATVTRMPGGSVRQGNPAAPLKLVEYGSRTCPVCGRFAMQATEKLRADWIATGKLSYEFRDFPVHPQDPGISMLGRCTSDRGYYRVLDAMFAEQEQRNAAVDTMSDAEFKAITALPMLKRNAAWVKRLGYDKLLLRLGMSQQRIDACLANGPALKAFADSVEDAGKKGVHGTPTFFLNGELLENVITWSRLEYVLQTSGA